MTEITDKAAIERFHTIILDLLLHPAFRGKDTDFVLSRTSTGKWQIRMVLGKVEGNYISDWHHTLYDAIKATKQQLGEN